MPETIVQRLRRTIRTFEIEDLPASESSLGVLREAAEELARVDERCRLVDILADVVQWSRATFPGREPLPTCAHLSREVSELMVVVAAKHPGMGAEMADVLILLAALADCCRVDLADAVAEKFAVLKERRWGPPDADGVREHVRTEAVGA